jgi:hypothetical protein
VHGGFEIVGDHDFGNAAEGMKAPHMRGDPVGQALGPGDLGIGVVGGTEHGKKHLGLVHLTALRVDDGQSLAGVVDKELFAGPVALAHDHIEFGGPGAIGLAKPAVLEATRGLGLVFLPKQRQGDAFAFEFLVHDGPVGVQVRYGAFGRRGREQTHFQGRFIEAVG